MNTDRNLRTRLLATLPVAALVFSLAACAAPVERPSAEEVAVGWQEIIEEAGQADLYTDELVMCIAEALVESEVSDQDLANLAEGRDVQTSQEAANLLTEVATQASADCAVAAQ